MFRKLAPQKVESDDGVIVQVTGRNSVQYVSTNILAEIYVEFSDKTYIFEESLKYSESKTIDRQAEKNNIINKIAEGLVAMGCTVDIIRPEQLNEL